MQTENIWYGQNDDSKYYSDKTLEEAKNQNKKQKVGFETAGEMYKQRKKENKLEKSYFPKSNDCMEEAKSMLSNYRKQN